MKKILSIILAISVTISAFTTVANAASYIDMPTDNEAIEVLTSLNIISGYEDGTVKPDQLITRAETATLIVNALNMKEDAVDSSSATKFIDVNEDAAWAKGFVNVGVAQGFINGYNETLFGPLDNVTYEQMCVMLTSITGYGDYAKVNGGWPSGYTTIAGQIGLNNKVVAATNAELTRGQVFQMIYNALVTPMLGVYEYSLVGNTYSQLDGKNGREYKTLLLDKFNGDIATIQITNTPVSNEALENDEVEFKVVKADYWSELETNVNSNSPYSTKALFNNVDVNNNNLQTGKGVFVTNEDDELILIYFAANGKTETKELSANTYVPQYKLASSKKYVNTNKIIFGSNSYKMAEEVTIYVNGASYATLNADNIDLFLDNAIGTIKLVKENSVDYYNAIFVNYYQIAKVTSVDTNDEKTIVTLVNTKEKLDEDYDYDEIVITNEAIEEGSTVIEVVRNDSFAEITDIKKGDIIAYAIDFNETDLKDPKNISIFATDYTVIGTVSNYDNDEYMYTIDGEKYGYLSGVKLNIKDTILGYFDPFGRIYSAETYSTSDKYAIVLKINDNDTITMLLPNGTVETYNYDGALIIDNSAELTERVVTYTFKNSTNTVTSLTVKDVTIDTLEYKSRTNKLGINDITNETYVIDATRVTDSTEARKASNYSSFNIDNFTNGTIYDSIVIKTGNYTNLVILTKIGTALTEESKFAIALDNPTPAYTEDGDDCYKVKTYYNGKIVDMLFTNTLVKEKDIFFFETDADGLVDTVYMYNNITSDIIDEEEWSFDIADERSTVILAEAVIVEVEDNAITFAKPGVTTINTNEDMKDSKNGIVTYGFADDYVSYVYDMNSDYIDYDDMVKVRVPRASNIDKYEGENEMKGVYSNIAEKDIVNAVVMIVDGDVVAIYSVVK